MIRYDQNLEREIRRTIKNFNAKVARLQSVDKSAPDKVKMREIRNMFDSRKDLQSYLKILQDFSKRGSEEVLYQTYDNTDVSRWRIRTADRMRTLAIHRLQKEVDEARGLWVTRGGEELIGTKIAPEYFNNKLATIKSLSNKKVKGMTMSEIKRYIAQIDSAGIADGRTRYWKDRYVEELISAGNQLGWDMEKVLAITKRIHGLSEQQFDLLYNREVSIKNLADDYPFLKRAKTEQDKEQISREMNSFLDTIYENLDTIFSEYE